MARLRNHLTFLIRCRENHVIPKGLSVTLPLASKSSLQIEHQTSLALLRQLIRDNRSKKVRISRDINTYTQQLAEVTTEEQRSQILEWCTAAATSVAAATKSRQIKKFNRLIARKLGPSLDADKVVKNISQRNLTEEEKQVLALGLNYAVTPKAIPAAEIISATETAARRLNTDTAERLRSGG